jgi:hypothetical protein
VLKLNAAVLMLPGLFNEKKENFVVTDEVSEIFNIMKGHPGTSDVLM